MKRPGEVKATCCIPQAKPCTKARLIKTSHAPSRHAGAACTPPATYQPHTSFFFYTWEHLRCSSGMDGGRMVASHETRGSSSGTCPNFPHLHHKQPHSCFSCIWLPLRQWLRAGGSYVHNAQTSPNPLEPPVAMWEHDLLFSTILVRCHGYFRLI